MSDTRFMLVAAGIFATGLILLTVVMLGSVYLVQKHLVCPRFGQATERPVRFDWWAGGCFVQTNNGQWVRTNNYWNSVRDQ